MNKIKTIIKKEWAEVFKNRMVLFTIAFLPLLMTAIPLAIIYSTRGDEHGQRRQRRHAGSSSMPCARPI